MLSKLFCLWMKCYLSVLQIWKMVVHLPPSYIPNLNLSCTLPVAWVRLGGGGGLCFALHFPHVFSHMQTDYHSVTFEDIFCLFFEVFQPLCDGPMQNGSRCRIQLTRKHIPTHVLHKSESIESHGRQRMGSWNLIISNWVTVVLGLYCLKVLTFRRKRNANKSHVTFPFV